ncbi:MAG: hypothetical protein ACPGJS_01620 [Flammeovirgaceae bacterium]
MRQDQHLSVLPYLYLSNSNTGGPNFKILLMNDGVGPALVESIKIIYDGKTYNQDLPNFLYKHIPEMDSINNIVHSNVAEGMLIPAGRQLAILEIENSQEDADKLFELLVKLNKKGLDLELIYQSIYNERWKIAGDSHAPQKLD